MQLPRTTLAARSQKEPKPQGRLPGGKGAVARRTCAKQFAGCSRASKARATPTTAKGLRSRGCPLRNPAGVQAARQATVQGETRRRRALREHNTLAHSAAKARASPTMAKRLQSRGCPQRNPAGAEAERQATMHEEARRRRALRKINFILFLAQSAAKARASPTMAKRLQSRGCPQRNPAGA